MLHILIFFQFFPGASPDVGSGAPITHDAGPTSGADITHDAGPDPGAPP